VTEWTDDNDPRFKNRWKKGEGYTTLIAQRLRTDGLAVVEPEKRFRESFKDRKAFEDEVDLVVNGRRVEVKSRKPVWTTLADFPFPDIFVDTVKKWDGHAEAPVAMMNICQSTGAIIVVPGKSHALWTRREERDNYSGCLDRFYFAPRSTWATYEQLVEFLGGPTARPIPKVPKLKDWLCHNCQDHYKMKKGGDYCVFCALMISHKEEAC